MMEPTARTSPPLPGRFWLACVGALLLGMGLRFATDRIEAGPPAVAGFGDRVADAVAPPDRARTPASYRGVGAWIDAFDFSPAYQPSGTSPALGPEVVDELASSGVRTAYIQAARRDGRSGTGLLDEELLGRFLLRAHRAGIHVVAWYLPRFDSVADDLAKVRSMAEFEVHGHRFDGIALDIEDTATVTDHAGRSSALLELVAAVRDTIGSDALGAIVPPAVQLDVVNPFLWPDFPWAALAPDVDVWLPMAYWTTRAADSGYRDAYRYSTESVRRMRDHLDSSVRVHLVGGIGDQTSPEDLIDFRDALERTDSIGGSIYDWNSMSDDLRQRLAAAVP